MKKWFKFLIPYIVPNKGKAIVAVLLSIPLASIKAYQVSLIKDVFDEGFMKNADFNQILFLSGVIFGLGIINYPCRFFHFYWIRFVVDRCTCYIRSDLFKKFQKLPLTFFTNSKQGSLISNTLMDTQVFSIGFHNMVDLIREPLTALFLMGLALYRDWQLTLVIIAAFPLFAYIFNRTGKRIRYLQGLVQERIALMTHSVSEGLAGQKITKAFNLQGYVDKRFFDKQEDQFWTQMRATRTEEHAHPMVELVAYMAFAGIIIFAHYRIIQGAMTIGDFISFGVALGLLMDPIRKFSTANLRLNQAMAAGKRIQDILSLPEEIDEGNDEIKGFNDSICFENVNFSYGEKKVLTDFNLKIKKGERVALVGLSGAGKSTIINLVLRLYPIASGKISVDNQPIESIKLESLRNLFGLVSQDIFLLNDTVLENLKMGRNFSEQQINKALDVSGSSEFVYQLENGLDTIVGDRGAKLSGGQAQRITIARAFLQDGPVLLFDEATSALDNESEKAVQKALDIIAGDKTVIAVAHRLSTIQNYDKIVVLKDGYKVEEGDHEDLMKLKGEYFKLYELSQKKN